MVSYRTFGYSRPLVKMSVRDYGVVLDKATLRLASSAMT